ncbi:MAG: antitoxin VbhA family protein [Solirubrobacterales bacterium]
MTERAQVAASAAGSLSLEGLEPSGVVRELADLWVRGVASDADLREAERRLLAGSSLDDLPTSVAASNRGPRRS